MQLYKLQSSTKMSEVYLEPILKQETEYIYESKTQDDNRKRFEDWLNSLKPVVDRDPEVTFRMISEIIESAKSAEILDSYRTGK